MPRSADHAALDFGVFCILSPCLQPSPIWYRQLQSILAKAGLATHTHFNARSRCSGSEYIWHIFGLTLGCYGRFWFLGSTWFRPTSAAFSGPHHFERNPQIMDTNHSGLVRELEQQIQHASPGTVLRKRPSVAIRGSRIAPFYANPLVLQSHVCRAVPGTKLLRIESVNPF
ncbi:unnamed protein product [Schistosoma curassoni]|uniref:Uncharacterized protein n=1 Tax=Schistosoma curassoni TaxID=6186 RepID=A0A183JLL4_9TREM|nr:unnamed protein product [Schistosoma curassoni]